MKRETVFVVDDDAINLIMGENALSPKYNVVALSSGSLLQSMLERMLPDLILLDIEMPEMDGYEVIKWLKANDSTASIPVIFVTARSDGESELTGLSLGAIDYITKPFSPSLLCKRIEVHLLIESQKRQLMWYNNTLQYMVEMRTRTVVELKNSVLRTIAELVECRDGSTGGHVDRTQSYLSVLLNAMWEGGIYRDELSKWNIGLVLQSANLHDVGKISIRDAVLRKPGCLTPEEYEEMKGHVSSGVAIIDRIKENTSEHAFLDHAAILVGTHHEKWDGSGYPNGLSGEGIPLQGRLMAIVDVYDALVSERSYKEPLSHEEAVKVIAEGRGRHFDPILVDLFLKVSCEFEKTLNS